MATWQANESMISEALLNEQKQAISQKFNPSFFDGVMAVSPRLTNQKASEL